MLIRLRKCQSTLEYTIVISLVVAALVSMQTYVKRSLQAKMKSSLEWRPEPAGQSPWLALFHNSIFRSTQYEPYYASSSVDTDQATAEQEVIGEGGSTGRATLVGIAQNQKQLVGWDDSSPGQAQSPGLHQITVFESNSTAYNVPQAQALMSIPTQAQVVFGEWKNQTDEFWEE